MLSLTAEGSLVLVADIDEFLVTPKPGMTVRRVLDECGPAVQGSRMGGLRIERFDALGSGYAIQLKTEDRILKLQKTIYNAEWVGESRALAEIRESLPLLSTLEFEIDRAPQLAVCLDCRSLRSVLDPIVFARC
jgi:hypothetical protein